MEVANYSTLAAAQAEAAPEDYIFSFESRATGYTTFAVTSTPEAVKDRKSLTLLHDPTAAAPMAEERETAQWYMAGGISAEQARELFNTKLRLPMKLTEYFQFGQLVNFGRLPIEAKDALRRELYRIRAIGEQIDRDNQAKEAAAEGEVKLMVSTKTGIKAWCVVWFGKMYPFPEDEGGHRTAVSALGHFREGLDVNYTDNPHFVDVPAAKERAQADLDEATATVANAAEDLVALFEETGIPCTVTDGDLRDLRDAILSRREKLQAAIQG